MASVETFVPEGFVVGRHPRVSPALSRLLERTGPQGAPQRIVAVLAEGADEQALQALLDEQPQWAARTKAPGVIELMATAEDVAQLAARDDLFRWLDVATRLFGHKLTDPAATVAVEVASSDPEAVRLELAARGGTLLGMGADGLLRGRIPASQLGTLLEVEAIEAIEVLGTA
ncbi:MAG: hypothetical protein KatS3mg102_0380 [Planctomycetota bacterium]|nr:MAG: hypothetical protein KatS3mg102_0380 [Planctomycetota bacterium]